MASSPSDLLQLVSSPLPFIMKNKLLLVIITTYLGKMHQSILITDLTWTHLPLCHYCRLKFHLYIHCNQTHHIKTSEGHLILRQKWCIKFIVKLYLRIWSSLSRIWGNPNFKIVERAKAYVFFWIEDTLSAWNQIQMLINKKQLNSVRSTWSYQHLYL